MRFRGLLETEGERERFPGLLERGGERGRFPGLLERGGERMRFPGERGRFLEPRERERERERGGEIPWAVRDRGRKKETF